MDPLMQDLTPTPGPTAPRTRGRLEPAEQDAVALLDRARVLVEGLEHREAGLVGRAVVLVSLDPEDVLLARLLKAYGAQVTFLGPAPLAWSVGHHPRVVHCLAEVLAREAPTLDVEALLAGEGPGVPVETRLLEELPGRQGEPFDLVLAVGMIPTQEEAAVEALRLLSGLARVNGVL